MSPAMPTPQVHDDSPRRSWWLFVHQLPPNPPGLRAKVWRRLQAIGAVQIKGSIYVLPALEGSLEDLEWLAAEIQAAGADASIWRATTVEGYRDEELVASFQQQCAAQYGELEDEARVLLGRVRESPALPAGPSETKRQLRRLRKRFQDVEQRDHFQAPRREVVGALLDEIVDAMGGETMTTANRTAPVVEGGPFRNRLWVTRARVYVDRIACAWLVRRCIDPDARFAFVADKRAELPADAVRFDMYEGEFTHVGERCSFEVMLERFGLDNPGYRALAEIVHDIDLKDEKFGRAETPGIKAVLDGIYRADVDDATRLARGAELFDDLYRRFGS